MKPSLVALYGPLQGSTFQWDTPAFTIGRDASNSLALSDSLVSRNHCSIQKEAGNFVIHDLKSRNGLFVNSIPTKTRALQHGDQIEIGDSLFLFLLQESQLTPSREALEEPETILPSFTTQLRLEDAIYLKPEKFNRRMERDLAILLSISATFHSLETIDELEEKLLRMLLEAIPADRAVLFPVEEESEHITTRAIQRTSGAESSPISKSLAAKVQKERIAVLASDLQKDPNFRYDSLVESRVHSLICVPVMAQGRLLAIIYLDTRDPAIRFDEGHLQLVTAIAGIAGPALKNLIYRGWLEGETNRLQVENSDSLVGESEAMRKVQSLIGKVGPTDSTVLITGESGTGKELVARAIHQNSPRKNKPFVAINCAVLAETLFESEIFGHEKGAFTGAISQKKGKLEIAEGGSVFLDEVSEIPASVQAKLLRVIQHREFERVGGVRTIRCDVRWIAATNRDLDAAVRSSLFRGDLFYRLNVLNIAIPPLRERREDILLLANYFVAKFGRLLRRRVKGISAAAQQSLLAYDWPGNVRELENAIEHALVLGSAELVQLDDLPERIVEIEITEKTSPTGYHDAIRETKKQLVLQYLRKTKGNITEAAKLLGVHPTYLHRLIHSLNLKSSIDQQEKP